MAASLKMNGESYLSHLKAGLSATVKLSDDSEERARDLQIAEQYTTACSAIHRIIDASHEILLDRLLLVHRFVHREKLPHSLFVAAAAHLLDRKLYRTLFTPVFRPYHGVWRCPGLVVYLSAEDLAPSMLMRIEYRGATWNSFRAEYSRIQLDDRQCTELLVSFVTEGNATQDFIFYLTEPDAHGIKDIMEVVNPQLNTASRLVRAKLKQPLRLSPENHSLAVDHAPRHEYMPNARLPSLVRRYFINVAKGTRASPPLKVEPQDPIDALFLSLHPLVIVDVEPTHQQQKLMAIVKAPL